MGRRIKDPDLYRHKWWILFAPYAFLSVFQVVSSHGATLWALPIAATFLGTGMVRRYCEWIRIYPDHLEYFSFGRTQSIAFEEVTLKTNWAGAKMIIWPGDKIYCSGYERGEGLWNRLNLMMRMLPDVGSREAEPLGSH